MTIPGAHAPAQIEKAAAIAHALQRGQFVLIEPPRR